MSQTEGFFCEYCAIEHSKGTEIDLRREYRLAVLSSITFVMAIVTEYLGLHPAVWTLMYVAVIAVAGRRIVPRGLRGAIHLHLDINFLMTFAAIAAIIIGAPAEGALVMLLFSIAELLEERADDRVKREIESIAKLQPHDVSVVTPDGEHRVHTEDVEVGAVIAVRPGERIGLDGVIVSGTTHVDEAPITGESVPVPKGPGEPVYAGTINQAGYIEVRVSRPAENTVLSRIIKMVKEAQENKSATESAVSKFSHKYTPAVVALSILIAAVSYVLGASPQAAVYRGLTLLVTSCPCAFAIAIPVSMVSSITGLAKQGVLVKGSRYIETVSKVTLVAFDKTGTLTKGSLRVRDVCVHSNLTSEDVLAIAASLEQKSEHPIAQALLWEARRRGLKLTDVSGFQVLPGMGVSGTISGVEHSAGNLRLLTARNIRLQIEEDHTCGRGSLVYVFRGNEHLGTISLSDTAKDESRDVIEQLKQMGIKTVMLTGDNPDSAHEIGLEVGITSIRADLMPEDKVTAVQQMATRDTVLMVGDGINDAPALAVADVSVAVGAVSTDAAIEAADIALMKDDLSLVPRLISKARRTMKTIRQNVTFALTTKMIVAGLAMLGVAPLWFAIAAGDLGVTFAVVANAFRLSDAS
ncbi:MAG: heavy metal translocating P-type ATPase [Candidatus Thorarchaeota archaeon]